MFFPLSLPSQAVNMGSNSLSSSCSDPMEGQPKAMAEYSPTCSGENSAAVITDTSAPLPLAPSATAMAMASVFPVPLQYTTATLLIRLNDLSFWICYGRNINQPR